jgi:hypothetical protein
MSKLGTGAPYNFGPRDLTLIERESSDQKSLGKSLMLPNKDEHKGLHPKMMMEMPSPPKMI